MRTSTLKILASLLFVGLMLSACDKNNDLGRLGGLWQLTEWKSTEDGQIKATKQDAIFYAFQLDLLKLSIHNDNNTYHLARFTHRNDSLILGTIYDRPEENIVTPAELSKYGVPLSAAFRIEELTHSKMVLRSDQATLTFRKY